MKKHYIKGHFIFELTMFRRNFVTAFFLLIFPTMMLLIFGSIYGNEPVEIYGGAGSIDMFIPSYSGIVIAVTGVMNIPLTICEYREKMIFKRYKATPTDPGYVIFSQLIINSLMTIFGMCLLIAVGKVIYDVKITENILPCLFIFITAMFCIFSIGFFIGGIAPNMKAANSIASLLFFPMLFLSGASVPYEILPKGVKTFSKFLPLTHSVAAMKSVWNGETITENLLPITILFITGIIFWGITKISFKWEC